MKALALTYFWLAQILMLVLAIAGWVILPLPCLLEAWETSPAPSINADHRKIDRWTWGWLNWIYGNPEDGVSGLTALVWSGSARFPFMPGSWAPWRAWVWSAWRNSTDALKYTLALGYSGPTFAVPLLGRTLRGGWGIENGRPVLVLSWKA